MLPWEVTLRDMKPYFAVAEWPDGWVIVDRDGMVLLRSPTKEMADIAALSMLEVWNSLHGRGGG